MKKTGRQPHDEDVLLRHLMQGTAAETGRSFFRALVKHFSLALGTHGAWVTEYIPETQRLRALAFWLGGDYIDDYEYNISGTPCQKAIEEKTYLHIPENVIELFPGDPDLRGMGAVSYIGFPMFDQTGAILGNLAVVDKRPMPDSFRNMALFKIFAARAAAEVLRMRAESESRTYEEKLAGLFRGAMDAIIELDEAFDIHMLNPSAERLLGVSTADITGTSFAAFLSSGDMQRIRQMVGRMALANDSPRSIWVPDGITLRTARGRAVPAEATLTLFDIGVQRYFALILRDVNERYESRKLIASLRGQTDYLRDEVRALSNMGEIIGESKAFRKTLQLMAEVAPTDATVLIYGETGTGKELMARAIHAAGRRKDRPLITVNCAAIPQSLMESEFFGHEKGAFTGATRRREGRFALADGGTIFLDEVGELHREMQAKLLRVLQEGEFSPVGSSGTRRANVRVIAATNRDLSRAVQEGRFRTDLYFRLNVFPITLPPLRERGDDIELLAVHLARRMAARMGRAIDPLTPGIIARLKGYHWPGNVRELQNVIERGIITARYGRLNLDHAFPLNGAMDAPPSSGAPSPDAHAGVKTIEEMQRLERSNVLKAMQAAQWRIAGKNGAARLLGVPPSTLQSKLKAMGIRRPETSN